jgi:phosphatidylserine/phosphatidylglycerophosphate/cardiolipin synthase-like enzyme
VTTLALTLVAGVLSAVPLSIATAAPVSSQAPLASQTASKAVAKTASTAARKPWMPPVGAVFNDPTGGPHARGKIVSRLRQLIRHTRRGATIRLSSFALDRRDVAELLIKAKRRGVRVQIVVMDHTAKSKTLPDHTDDADDPEASAPDIHPKVNKAQNMLVKALGKNRHKSSFIVFCRGACRNGSSGDLHTKVYSFSQSGGAKYVIMTTSGNLTYGAAFAQWNDAYTVVGDRDLFATWVHLFHQLRSDRKVKPRQVIYSSPARSFTFHRQSAASKNTTTSSVARAGSKDPVLKRMARITCAAPKGSGIDGHTAIRIIMYAWYGKRGDAIARRLAELQRQGCRTMVIGSVLGPSTARILRGAGIPVKAADWDFGDRISTSGQAIVTGPRCYSHYKVLVVSGAIGGLPKQAVWTGSENWSSISFGNDEVTLKLNGRHDYVVYKRLFNRMWNDPRATHAVGVKPTRRTCATG